MAPEGNSEEEVALVANEIPASDDKNEESDPPTTDKDEKASYGAVNGEKDEKPKVKPVKFQKPSTAKASRKYVKTNSSFWDDAREFEVGTIPHSMVMALAIGTVCGIAAFLYYKVLFAALEYIWHTIPETYIVDVWPEWTHVFWIPIVGFTMAAGVGLSVMYLGEPGDLPYTVKCVHEDAYIAMDHVLPMVAASQFSILGGGSYGPEAPLVAICAALGGFISRQVFKVEQRNIVRKHTLMGMAGALAAFFGVPLGGSLFALEVCNRFGLEYFEHMVEAIFAGVACLVVFRGLAGLPMEAIWTITEVKLPEANASEVIVGGVLGLVGALIAFIFAKMHWSIMGQFQKYDLLRNERALYRAFAGAVAIVGIGMFIPHTMFWGEFEFQTIATGSPASTLDHVWPTSGAIGFEMDNGWKCLLVGIFKMIAISITVCGGYRGGFIFPFFSAGAAFGRALTFIFPWMHLQVATLCVAAAINVAITRTSLATSLILCYLSGEQMAMPAVLTASLVSLFVTGYMVRYMNFFLFRTFYILLFSVNQILFSTLFSFQPFIKTQIVRNDIDTSLFHAADSGNEYDESKGVQRRFFAV
mmetsp:Transcript_5718/g.8812  ORF Transcript_5718/g.8812 Transcript_5718/m.8812 type:complete len:586 (+) Transcript_5718:112-1869(+)